MGDGDARAILSWLRQQQPAMAELLEQLAVAESPSLEPDTQDQPFAILSEELQSLGYEVSRVAGEAVGDHLKARPIGSDATRYQLLLGHMDTVWPSGTINEMPVRVEDDRLSGPGVYDMKGGLVQMIFALRALREHRMEPSVTPLVFVNTDEEIGSRESGAEIHTLATDAVRALVMEPSFGPSGKLKTARKGVGRYTVHIKGRASHAGLDPERGISAILEASHQVQRLFELNDHERGITVNVGTIDGGLRPNVVAPEVTAVVDARVLHGQDIRAIDEAIHGLEPVQEGIAIEVEGGFGRSPLERTSRNRELWEAARAAGHKLGVSLDEATVGGASDGNITSLYTATLDGLGPVGAGAHAPHEYVSVSEMPERAALLAMLVMLPG